MFQTITATDIATVRKLGRPPYLITVIMDAVLVLFGRKVLVTIDQERQFVNPNWSEALRVCVLVYNSVIYNLM